MGPIPQLSPDRRGILPTSGNLLLYWLTVARVKPSQKAGLLILDLVSGGRLPRPNLDFCLAKQAKPRTYIYKGKIDEKKEDIYIFLSNDCVVITYKWNYHMSRDSR